MTTSPSRRPSSPAHAAISRTIDIRDSESTTGRHVRVPTIDLAVIDDEPLDGIEYLDEVDPDDLELEPSGPSHLDVLRRPAVAPPECSTATIDRDDDAAGDYDRSDPDPGIDPDIDIGPGADDVPPTSGPTRPSVLTRLRCLFRRNVLWQMMVPCALVAAAAFAVFATSSGGTRGVAQILLTASLVTIGVAWVHGIDAQRRRQDDLRFRLSAGSLERADLSGTVLDGFTLWGQNLRHAQMSGCSADHALLTGADLTGAVLAGASMRATALAGADLTGVRAYRLDLSAADLTGAVVRASVFEQAVLRGARLEGADLRGVDLTGADLRGASHDETTRWAGALVSADTTLPDDLDAAAVGIVVATGIERIGAC